MAVGTFAVGKQYIFIYFFSLMAWSLPPPSPPLNGTAIRKISFCPALIVFVPFRVSSGITVYRYTVKFPGLPLKTARYTGKTAWNTGIPGGNPYTVNNGINGMIYSVLVNRWYTNDEYFYPVGHPSPILGGCRLISCIIWLMFFGHPVQLGCITKIYAWTTRSLPPAFYPFSLP